MDPHKERNGSAQDKERNGAVQGKERFGKERTVRTRKETVPHREKR